MTVETRQVLIYALCEPGTEIIRYIGKCVDTRVRVRQHLAEARRPNRNSYRCNWIRSLDGNRPAVLILEKVAEGHWEDRERYWIDFHRRSGANLTNTTDGGEGLNNPSEEVRRKIGTSKRGNKNCVGRVISEETRQLMSGKAKGRQHTNEARAKMSTAQTGRKHTEETKKKMSAARKGKAQSPAQIKASRLARIGLEFSAAHRQNLSAAGRGKPKSEEHRAAISKALRGKTRASEHCAALSEALRIRGSQIPNLWHEAICAQLRAAKRPLIVSEIWDGLLTSGFRGSRKSEPSKKTLTPRITELVKAKRIERLEPSTYRLLEEQVS